MCISSPHAARSAPPAPPDAGRRVPSKAPLAPLVLSLWGNYLRLTREGKQSQESGSNVHPSKVGTGGNWKGPRSRRWEPGSATPGAPPRDVPCTEAAGGSVRRMLGWGGGVSSKRVSLVQFHFYPKKKKKKAQDTVPGCPRLGTFWKDTPHLTEGISRV